MRIIREINKGNMKVSVFKYEGRVTIKAEMDQNEITLKYNEGSIIEEESNLNSYVNEHFINELYHQLSKIDAIKTKGLVELEMQTKDELKFPEIV